MCVVVHSIVVYIVMYNNAFFWFILAVFARSGYYMCMVCTISPPLRMCGGLDIKQMSGKHFITKWHVLGLRNNVGGAPHHLLSL